MAQKESKPKKVSRSGKIGGPATFSGVSFQTEYAVLETLNLICENLVLARIPAFIGVEPRLTSGAVVAAWDIISGAPEVAAEAKENPNVADVIEFLKRITNSPGSNVTHRLVFGKSGTLGFCTV
jgi:hypothetical protein